MKKSVKNAINHSLCLLACLQLASCKVVSNKPINKKFDQFVRTLDTEEKTLESQQKQLLANNLKSSAKKIEKLINRAPKLRTWQDRKNGPGREQSIEKYNNSKDKIRTWMADVKNLTMGIHGITYKTGKNSFKMTEKGRLKNTPIQLAQNEMITLYSLTYLRNLSEGYINRSLQYMNKLSSKGLAKYAAEDEFKLEVMQQYMAYMGMIKIVDKDAKETLTKLKRMRDRGILPDNYNDNISQLLGSERNRSAKKVKAFNDFKDEALTKEQIEEFDKALTAFETTFNKKSLLFDPANPDHPLIHLFVIASNLSWGLINTMVGGAFVATAAVLAPVSRVVNKLIDTLFPRFMFRMYEIKFPTIRISESRMQIYADVCGLGIVSGKMSAGLFELDFCTSQGFATNHEAGHAKQSALLGPLYFPAAILSYILVGGHGGFIEEWADIWAVKQTW